MEIAMVGHSDAGKTSLMAAMYGELQAGWSAFSVRAADDATHEQLKQMATALRAGRYPRMTDRRQSYDLRLRHRDGAELGFRWVDHRGSALLDSATDVDTAALLADLDRSDALVVFADAHDLTTEQLGRLKLRSVITALVPALSRRRGVTPVVVVCSKADLCTKLQLKQVHEMFDSLVRAMSRSSVVHGTIVDVSVGRMPRNVALPVLWCLRFGLGAEADQLRRRERRLREESQRKAADDHWLDRLIAELLEQESSGEIAARKEREADAARAEMSPFVTGAEALHQLVSVLPHF